jgi:hypothetical protein
MEIKMLYGEKITAAFFPLPGIMRITGRITAAAGKVRSAPCLGKDRIRFFCGSGWHISS